MLDSACRFGVRETDVHGALGKLPAKVEHLPRPHSGQELPQVSAGVTRCHAVARGGTGWPLDSSERGRPTANLV